MRPAAVTPFARHLPRRSPLPSLAAEATPRLSRFVPPFRFTSFFAPEDTLLCVITAEAALAALGGEPPSSPPTGVAPPAAQRGARRIVELTTGSGLVGLRLLDIDPRATLLGSDIDHGSPPLARANAALLGLGARARFERASIWDAALEQRLRATPIDLLVCNPPYIPEPPGGALPAEAGAGPDGAAHVRRVIQLAAATRPARMALSWCSLCDPAGVVAAAQRAGYRLDALYAAAIGDGEYSGAVHRYLHTLPTAFFSEAPDVIAEVAPDGAARFAYLLLAGVFSPAPAGATTTTTDGEAPAAVDRLVREFVSRGTEALVAPAAAAPFPVAAWLLDRWDEIALRAYLHGALDQHSLADGARPKGRRTPPRGTAPPSTPAPAAPARPM